jgi:YhcH/YjgK/YiaL family protein
MILDSIDHSPQYERLGARFAKAFRFLRDTALADLAPGRYEIDGPKVFALVSDYETKTIAASRWEAHRKHVDVQVVASGEERVGVAPLETLNQEPYDDEKDILFARGDGEFVTLVPGRFVVLFPQDAHMPGVAAGDPAAVKKIVVKIAV